MLRTSVSTSVRTFVATVAVAGLTFMGAGTGISGAVESPYTPTATTTVNTTNPKVGAKLRMSGSGWGSKENVVISIHSKKKVLKSVKTTRAGTYKTKIKLPKKYKCEHTIKVKGKKSDRVTKIRITIGKLSKC